MCHYHHHQHHYHQHLDDADHQHHQKTNVMNELGEKKNCKYVFFLSFKNKTNLLFISVQVRRSPSLSIVRLSVFLHTQKLFKFNLFKKKNCMVRLHCISEAQTTYQHHFNGTVATVAVKINVIFSLLLSLKWKMEKR